MPISQNTALFSLLGTTYGGDGKSTFALPDLEGSGADFSKAREQGCPTISSASRPASETVTLHPDRDAGAPPYRQRDHVERHGDAPRPAAQLAKGLTGGIQNPTNAKYYSTAAPNTFLNPMTALIDRRRSSFPHNNLMPYLVLNFCIALQGVFPPRP